MRIKVHDRVCMRHPELTAEDVIFAWQHFELGAVRQGDDVEIRMGFDSNARPLEMAGVMEKRGWLIFHALTPPTKRMIREIESLRRGLWPSTD